MCIRVRIWVYVWICVCVYVCVCTCACVWFPITQGFHNYSIHNQSTLSSLQLHYNILLKFGIKNFLSTIAFTEVPMFVLYASKSIFMHCKCRYLCCLLTVVCNPPCANGGACVANDTCNCPLGYEGDWCILPGEHFRITILWILFLLL